MKIPQYSTEYSGLLDETSRDLVDTDTSACGDGTKDGKEAIIKAQRKISGPSGTLVVG